MFPKKGRPYPVIEPLPEGSEDLETAIVRKFIGALLHFKKRSLILSGRGTEWPDFVAVEEDRRVGIEVVEVVNIEHARKRALQRQYLELLLSTIEPFCGQLRGLRIRMDDGQQDPPYPSPTSRDGKQLIQFIVDNLQSNIEKLRQLPIGRSVHHVWQNWKVETRTPRIGILARRLAPAESECALKLEFFDGFGSRAGVRESLLEKTLLTKVKKAYTSYKNGPLILLAYGDDPIILQAEAIEPTKKMLSSNRHPFNEVWSFFPYAAKDLGGVRMVWP